MREVIRVISTDECKKQTNEEATNFFTGPNSAISTIAILGIHFQYLSIPSDRRDIIDSYRYMEDYENFNV